MFQDDAVYAVIMFFAAAWLFKMWLGDYMYFKSRGEPRKGAFEGASPAPVKLVVAGVVGALILLGIHSLSETLLGVAQEQTKVSVWALFSWCAAAFLEELIFRGYLVVKNRGVVVLIASIFIFSLIFAAAHPFLWDYEVPEGAALWDGNWKFDLSLQPALSTFSIFECSLLFYLLRFVPSNVNRSILPCMAAHLSYNIGVFAVKLFSGFVEC